MLRCAAARGCAVLGGVLLKSLAERPRLSDAAHGWLGGKGYLLPRKARRCSARFARGTRGWGWGWGGGGGDLSLDRRQQIVEGLQRC
jgi:hypothetical protein